MITRQYLFQSIVDLVALLLGLIVIRVLDILFGTRILGGDVIGSIQANTFRIWPLIGFSIILTVVHWFIRPVLVVFFGTWMLRSFGLFSVLLDIILFAFALALTPYSFQTSAAPWWAI